jgi:hypothetical protein
VSINNTDYISSGSITIRPLVRPILALMLIEVIILVISKNSLIELTRKE